MFKMVQNIWEVVSIKKLDLKNPSQFQSFV